MAERTGRWAWLVGLLAAGSAQAAEMSPAAQVLKDAGVAGGLAVVVATTDGALEAELAARPHMLVQGLALSDEAADRARRHIIERKLNGRAPVRRLEGDGLPYADSLVNLVLQSVACRVSRLELLRCCCPFSA